MALVKVTDEDGDSATLFTGGDLEQWEPPFGVVAVISTQDSNTREDSAAFLNEAEALAFIATLEDALAAPLKGA